MESVRIRAAAVSDAEAITEIFNCPGVVAGTLQLPYRTVEERREWLAQRSPGVTSLVAEVDGRVVGVIGLHRERAERRSHVADLGMCVHDDYQHRGIGSALVAAVVDLADRWLGLQRIELTVFTDNVPAIRLYEKFGFTIEGTAQRFALRDGAYVDAYYMARVRPLAP